jgi:hypothetical protein
VPSDASEQVPQSAQDELDKDDHREERRNERSVVLEHGQPVR